MPSRSSILGLLCICPALLVAACDFTKINECNAAIDTINGGKDLMEHFDPNRDPLAQADKLDEFEKKLGAVKLTDGELKKRIDEYRALIRDISKLARELEAQEVEDFANRREQIAKREDALVDSINGYCGS